MKYRKKPIEVEAFRLGEEWPDWWANAISSELAITHNNDGRYSGGPDFALVTTTWGRIQRADHGDWIIRGPYSDLSVVKPSEFEATYEPAED